MASATKTQPKIHVLFSFGWHSGGFGKVAKSVDAFKPHVYAMEASLLTRGERAGQSSSLNSMISKAKEDPAAKKQMLGNIPPCYAFQKGEISHLIDSKNRIAVFPLEAHKGKYFGDPLVDLQDGQNEVFRLLYEDNIPLAIAKEMQAYQKFAEVGIRSDRNMVENIATLRQDILSQFSHLKNKETIRVFARLGSAHTCAYVWAMEKYSNNPRILLDRKFDPSFEFFPDEWITRAISFGKPVKDDWLLRAALTDIMQMANIARLGFDKSCTLLKENAKVSKQIPAGALVKIFKQSAWVRGRISDWAVQVSNLARKAVE
ncbi:Uncharacterised protein [uncultured archaeon]|nr:Uncharacterised protein [uncultured archaeon]